MLASLVDTMLDISSSALNLVAIHFALKPPDDDHRFGHEKIQDLAIFSQSIFFFISGTYSLIISTYSLLKKELMEHNNDGYIIMSICIISLLILLLYQTYVIKKTNSEIIKLDKMHYSVDLMTNCAVILSIFLNDIFWFADAAFGILISLYIIKTSFSFFKTAIKNLIDQEFDNNKREEIISIVIKNPHVKGVHDMKTRYAAHKSFIQCHIEIDGNMSLHEAHDITEKIHCEILNKFPDSEIIIHQDPHEIYEKVEIREI
jgi:cation diffusion facilitator family transporter